MTLAPVLCLASASPRRRDLLTSIGVMVEVRPVDKAVGYPIQGLVAVFVERVEGSHSAVVGPAAL